LQSSSKTSKNTSSTTKDKMKIVDAQSASTSRMKHSSTSRHQGHRTSTSSRRQDSSVKSTAGVSSDLKSKGKT
jgi:hypothetical protein